MSELGEKLEWERDKILFAKLGATIKVLEKLSDSDRKLVGCLMKRAANEGGHFTYQSDSKEFEQIGKIYDIISGNVKEHCPEEIAQLLNNAIKIVREGLLTPGRRALLSSYIETAETRDLTKNELDTIRFFSAAAFNQSDVN